MNNIMKLGYTITTLLMLGFSVSSIAQSHSPAQQCLQLPERQDPCTNLIYSSFNNNGVNTQFCLCKSDKSKLITLFEQGNTADDFKLIRQLVSQYRLTQPELLTLLQSVY
ncbi:MAG: hypothetical protein HRU23_03375 [Gammaproteobacteria bacterium]|nr:hypothetical protein [Gammaproteobacteria bacterium]